MAVTDVQGLNTIQSRLIEPEDDGATFPSGHWTATEVLQALIRRQNDFLKRTSLLMKISSPVIDSPVGTHRLSLPTDWILTYRAGWKPDSDAATPANYKEVPRADSGVADLGIPTWESTNAARPRLYSDTETPTLTCQLAPAPSVDGSLELVYSHLATALTGAGASFSVPDEYVPGIVWGALATLLNKVGRGQDLPRAQYCEGRYEETVEAALALLRGFEALGS